MKKFKKLSKSKMIAIKGGADTIIGSGRDSGGHYHIIDDGFTCSKVYQNHTDEFSDALDCEATL